MIDQRIYKKNIDFHGSKGLVFIGEKIIVYRRDGKTDRFPFHIDLPGGGKEENETPFETFQREVKEEFGIEVQEKDITYAKQYVSSVDPTKEAYFIVVKPKDIQQSQIVFGDEGVEYFLVTTEEFLNFSDAIERQQKKVIDYIESLKQI